MSVITGVVKWFDKDRGYGYISAENGRDVFVHYSQVKEKTHNKDLHEGEQVTFDIVEKDNSIMAINVQKID